MFHDRQVRPGDPPFVNLEGGFRNLLEALPDAIIVVDAGGTIVLVNAQAERLFGHHHDAMIGRPIEILLPQRFHEVHLRHRHRFISMPQVRPMGAGLDLYGRRANGEEFPVEISLSPLPTEDGLLVLSAIRDISDRRRADEKFKALLEAAPDAFVIVNEAGEIVLVNTQTERLFGYRREELLGTSVDVLVPARFESTHARHRGRFISDPRVREMGAGLELYGRRKDGTEFPVEISLSPIRTDDGLLVSSAIRDISDRKLASERRRMELEEQNRQIREANRLKSEFLANMSHELRTPLNGIIGFSEFLFDGRPGPLNTKQKEYLGDIINSGKHLLQLINDVLDLAKVEAGRAELTLERFHFSETIREVTSVLSQSMKERSLRLDVEVAPQIDDVTLDLQKVKQILYNLLSNAMKFNKVGGSVTVRVDPHGRQYVRLSVKDTGIGIKNEDFGRLFIEFQQLDSGTDRQYPGTGLGLTLTKKLVELQQGSITVQSVYGKGSTFVVTLPRRLKGHS